MHHGLQHLCSRNNLFSLGNSLLDDLLLKHGNLFERNLHAHIPSGNHNTIGNLDDFIQVFNSLHIFNLRDNHHLGIALIQNLTNLQDILLVPYKGCGNNIEAQLHTE